MKRSVSIGLAPSLNLNPLPSRFGNGLTRAAADFRAFFSRPASVLFGYLMPFYPMVWFSLVSNRSGSGDPSRLHGILRDMALAFPGNSIWEVSITSALAMCLLLTCWQATAFQVVADREMGPLKRLSCTPFSFASYLTCRAGFAFMLAISQIIILMTIGYVRGIHPFGDAAKVWVFIGMLVLGFFCFTLLGITFGGIVNSIAAAKATLTWPVIVLIFITGVGLPISTLPQSIQGLTYLIPVTSMGEGMRFALLPDSAKVWGAGGHWHIGVAFLGLAVWSVIGALGAVWTFKRRGFDRIV